MCVCVCFVCMCVCVCLWRTYTQFPPHKQLVCEVKIRGSAVCEGVVTCVRLESVCEGVCEVVFCVRG